MSTNILLAGCGDKVQDVLSMLLNRSGFEVHNATTVHDALGGFWNAPSMIVIDLAMEDGTGLEVLKSVRKHRLETRVAVVSSGCEAPGSNWINKYQPNAIFGKPFDFQDFVQWMSEFDLRSISPATEVARQAA